MISHERLAGFIAAKVNSGWVCDDLICHDLAASLQAALRAIEKAIHALEEDVGMEDSERAYSDRALSILANALPPDWKEER
jgi:hypothetical protein